MDIEKTNWPGRTGFLESCVHGLLVACEVHGLDSPTVETIRKQFAEYELELNGKEYQMNLPLEKTA